MLFNQKFKVHTSKAGSAAIAWLGQSGYLLKSPGGVRIVIDPYLSDSLSKDEKFPLPRLKPPLLKAEDLEVDLFLCTHSHPDHADFETLEVASKNKASIFAAPGGTQEILEKAGVDKAKREIFWPGREMRLEDVTIQTTFAVPTDASDLSPVGYLLSVDNGPKLFFCGDTDNHPLLAKANDFQPDVMFVCINGTFNNLSHWEAAELSAALKTKIAVPCHYGMFENNTIDPHQFKSALQSLNPEIVYKEFEYGEIWDYQGDGK